MRDDWKPLVHAACVAADRRFAIAFGEFEYEDPFFVLIDYDGGVAQPWARRDVQREMSAIIPPPMGTLPSSRYVALSREGDVYFLADETSNERIVGAGIASSDSRHLGEMFDLANIAGQLWAVGGKAQLYKREGTAWKDIARAAFDELALGAADLGLVAGTSENDIYITYVLQSDETVIPKNVREELLKSGSWDDWNDAYKQAESKRLRRFPRRGLLHWNGTALSPIDIPPTIAGTIDALYLEEKDNVYIAGNAGFIAKGNFKTGLTPLMMAKSNERILSVVEFQGSVYFCTSRSVMRITENRVEKIGVPFPAPRPLKLATSEKYLFYFDSRAKIAFFDGKGWDRISIPERLLARDFHGL